MLGSRSSAPALPRARKSCVLRDKLSNAGLDLRVAKGVVQIARGVLAHAYHQPSSRRHLRLARFSRVRPKRRDFEQVFAPASSARSNMVCCDRGLMCNSLPTTSRRV